MSANRPGQRKPGFNPPRATATLGMWLFLAALFMLFAAGLLGYVVIRVLGGRSPALGSIHTPWIFFVSTVPLLGVSVAVHQAVKNVRWERQAKFRLWIGVMAGCAFAFILAQTPAMWMLLQSQRGLSQVRSGLYALIFFLVLVHALHVIGGLAWLARIAAAGFAGRYDHEHYEPVRHAAMYWHFLDAVWLVMFGTFLILR